LSAEGGKMSHNKRSHHPGHFCLFKPITCFCKSEPTQNDKSQSEAEEQEAFRCNAHQKEARLDIMLPLFTRLTRAETRYSMRKDLIDFDPPGRF